MLDVSTQLYIESNNWKRQKRSESQEDFNWVQQSPIYRNDSMCVCVCVCACKTELGARGSELGFKQYKTSLSSRSLFCLSCLLGF